MAEKYRFTVFNDRLNVSYQTGFFPAYVYLTVSLLPYAARRQDYNNRIPYFLSELKRTGVTRLLLWQEYHKANPQGYGYTRFCVLLSEFQKNSQTIMRIIHRPAQQVMVDFASAKLS